MTANACLAEKEVIEAVKAYIEKKYGVKPITLSRVGDSYIFSYELKEK
jgi:hypothetical protein